MAHGAKGAEHGIERACCVGARVGTVPEHRHWNWVKKRFKYRCCDLKRGDHGFSTKGCGVIFASKQDYLDHRQVAREGRDVNFNCTVGRTLGLHRGPAAERDRLRTKALLTRLWKNNSTETWRRYPSSYPRTLSPSHTHTLPGSIHTHTPFMLACPPPPS
jgi:hypothetical protein